MPFRPAMTARITTLLSALLLLWTASEGLSQAHRAAPGVAIQCESLTHPLRGTPQSAEQLTLPDGVSGGLFKAVALLPAFVFELPPRRLDAPAAYHASHYHAPRTGTASARAPPLFL